jgi:hypothetical protein
MRAVKFYLICLHEFIISIYCHNHYDTAYFYMVPSFAVKWILIVWKKTPIYTAFIIALAMFKTAGGLLHTKKKKVWTNDITVFASCYIDLLMCELLKIRTCIDKSAIGCSSLHIFFSSSSQKIRTVLCLLCEK